MSKVDYQNKVLPKKINIKTHGHTHTHTKSPISMCFSITSATHDWKLRHSGHLTASFPDMIV